LYFLYLHFWQRGNKFRVKGQKGKLRDTERNEDFSTENSRGGTVQILANSGCTQRQTTHFKEGDHVEAEKI